MPTEKPPRLLCGRCASTCEHSNQRMVKFTQQNGRLAYRHQCLTCSHGQGASRTRMSRTRTRSGGATIRGPGNLPSPALAAGHGRHRTSPLGTARANSPGVLGGQQLRSPTGWFSELILPDYRSAAAAGRRVINSSGSGPGTRSIADSGAVRQDLRRATSRQLTSSIPHGSYQLLVARGPGC
jgi:hypothetical protein